MIPWRTASDERPSPDALRTQFPRVDPQTLCPPGGMTKTEFVKFLSTLARTIERDKASG
jgi:hypothetical protein